MSFDIKKYYNETLTTSQERTYFRVLINKKIGTKDNAFYQWLNREKVPGYAEILILEIIRDPSNNLPQVDQKIAV